MDRLQTHPNHSFSGENIPNPYDGHGADGANVIFTDGHATYVKHNKWQDMYKTSEDDPSNNGVTQ